MEWAHPAEVEVHLQALVAEIVVCTQCPLGFSRRNAVPGEGPPGAQLFIVGEAPGASEDASGLPFVGASGRLLRRELAAVGLDPKAIFITSVVKCRPPGNRQPRIDEVSTCTSLYLARQIALQQPRALVALGSVAAGALLAGEVKITREHGTWRQDYDLTPQTLPVYLCYHPAAALRNERWRVEFREDLQRLAEYLRP